MMKKSEIREQGAGGRSQNKIRGWWLLALLLLPTITYAGQKPDAGQPGYFLKLATGANILAMGGAGVACPDSGIFINPAGIAMDEGKKLQITTIALPFPDTSYNYLSYTQNIGRNWGIGLGVPSLKVTGAEKRPSEYESSGRFDDQYVAFGLGIARILPLGLSAGLTIKAIQQQFCEEATSTTNIDLGLLYQHKGKDSSPIAMGICLQNILSLSGNGDEMPQTVNIGIGYHPIDRVLLAVDIKKSNKQATRLHLGGEYCPTDTLSLRTGYDAQGYLTAGVGIRVGGITIDYGLQNHDYKLSHRVSVGIGWGK